MSESAAALCLKRSGEWECCEPADHEPGCHTWRQTEEAILFHSGWTWGGTVLAQVVMTREEALTYLRSSPRPAIHAAHLAAQRPTPAPTEES